MTINYPFKPLKKIRLYEEIADQIKNTVFNGQLKPGDPLPSERELAGMFNVGRPTVREALRTLDVLGIIELNQIEKGYIVRENDVAQYLETLGENLSWLIKPERKTLADLWEVRKYIELGICHVAAQKATDKDLADLDLLIEEMNARMDDFESYFPLAADFHKKLALITGNRFFYIIWAMIQNIMLKGYTPVLKTLFPGGPSKLYEANKLLVEAIRSRDPEKIGHAMEVHSMAEAVFNNNHILEEKK